VRYREWRLVGLNLAKRVSDHKETASFSRIQELLKAGLVGSPVESWLVYDPYGLLSSSSCHMMARTDTDKD